MPMLFRPYETLLSYSKTGVKGINIIFHVFAQNVDCVFMLELPLSMFCAKYGKNIIFHLKIVNIYSYENRSILHSCVNENYLSITIKY